MERLPLALALHGDTEAAYDELAKMRQEIGDSSNMMFRYLRFIEGFEAEFPPCDG
jgi:hypothetical protein